MWTLLFFSHMIFATCKIPKPPVVLPKDFCPVTMNHLDRIKEYYKCRKPKGPPRKRRIKSVALCEQKAKSLASAKATLIPAALQAGLSAREKSFVVTDFFNDVGSDLSSDIAEEQFKRDYQKAVKNHSQLIRLKRKHTRLKIQARGGDKKAKLILEKFEFDRENRRYLRALEMHSGSISDVREPVFRYSLSDGKLHDIANMDFKDVPPDIVEDRSQPKTLIKQAYFRSSNRGLEGVKQQLLQGKNLDDIKSIQGVSDKDFRLVKGLTKRRAIRFRDKVAKTATKGNYQRILGKARVKPKGSLFSRIMKGSWLVTAPLAIYSAAAGRQESCDKGFPLYPTSFKKSEVVGLPLSHSCHFYFPPKNETLPKNIKKFFELSNEELYKALRTRDVQETRYTCRYYRMLYNQMFCQGEGSDEGDHSPTEN